MSRTIFRRASKVVAFALGVIVVLSLLQYRPVFAQSTIFNIPSTDVVARKKVYFEFDLVTHLESHENGGFQSYVPRVVVGLGKGVEMGPTVGEAQPNIKWQFYSNENSGMAMTVGAIAYTPLKDRSSFDTFGFFYGNMSKKFKGDHGPRFTVGGYGLGGYDVE